MASNLWVEITIRTALFGAIGLGAAGWTRFRNGWKQKSSKDWPETVATIHSGEVKPVPQSSMHSVELSYSYYVDEYRSGIYQVVVASSNAGYDIVRRFKDRKVRVRYNPKNADKSVLDATSMQQVEDAAIVEEIAADNR